jgi:hypothetical protein
MDTIPEPEALQVPPRVASVRVTDDPVHKAAGPVMGDGRLLMVTVVVA